MSEIKIGQKIQFTRYDHTRFTGTVAKIYEKGSRYAGKNGRILTSDILQVDHLRTVDTGRDYTGFCLVSAEHCTVL